MPALAALISFTANTLIKNADMNSNFAALRTWSDNSVVMTDVAKTISVTHTFSASQTFSAGALLTGTVTIQATSALTTAFNTTAGATSDAISVVFQRGGANKWRIGSNITGANADVWSVYNDGLASDVLSFNNSTGFGTFSKGLAIGAAASQLVPGATSFAVRNNANNADNLLVTDAGNATVRGNLTVTGTLSGGTGFNNYVRRTSDLTFTSATDLTLTFAIGTADEWEFEFVLAHTNASAATVNFTIAGPASSTGFFGGFGTTNNAATAMVGDAEVTMGNAMTAFNMNATAAYAHIRGYVKGGGTAGNVTISGTVSAGTGTLKAGSYVRYAKIA